MAAQQAVGRRRVMAGAAAKKAAADEGGEEEGATVTGEGATEEEVTTTARAAVGEVGCGREGSETRRSDGIHGISRNHTDGPFLDKLDDGLQPPSLGPQGVHLHVHHCFPFLLDLSTKNQRRKVRSQVCSQQNLNHNRIQVEEGELKGRVEEPTLKKRGAEYFKRLGFRFIRARTGRCRGRNDEGGCEGRGRPTTERWKVRDGAAAKKAEAIASNGILSSRSSRERERKRGRERENTRILFSSLPSTSCNYGSGKPNRLRRTILAQASPTGPTSRTSTAVGQLLPHRQRLPGPTADPQRTTHILI
ncbi:hypothetical protein GW17_00035331 [Ensete ventricosum]|nr:hypothetical protein GW17_00035331 [Ensete ventricosum]